MARKGELRALVAEALLPAYTRSVVGADGSAPVPLSQVQHAFAVALGWKPRDGELVREVR